MSEDEFRKRFDQDRHDNKLTWVANDEVLGIAVGLNGPDKIILFKGGEMSMESAHFVDMFD